MRTTIDYGIDLGYSHSAIAVAEGKKVQVLRDNENQECMPSCVYINRRGEARIGRAAYERVDNVDGYGQFKRLMGTQHTYEFGSSGRKMSPEDLSAEVLKELRKVAVLRRNEDVRAAVITVLAAFDLPQCDATQEAARGVAAKCSVASPQTTSTVNAPKEKVSPRLLPFSGTLKPGVCRKCHTRKELSKVLLKKKLPRY